MIYRQTRLMYGWGINDVDYNIYKYETVAGKQKQVWKCPYYIKWSSMIGRCVSPKIQEKQPAYKGCTVCEEWKYLSNFIKWVDSQPNRDWQNCSLDKDLLVLGNTEYNPDNCIYITNNLNSFITDSGASRGNLMIGVTDASYKIRNNIYCSRCCNPFTKNREHLGYYATELEAHKAWQAKKHALSCQLADLQDDPRVADALRQRYAPDKDWSNK